MAREIYGHGSFDVVAQLSSDGDYEPSTGVFDVLTTRTGSTVHTNLLNMAGGAITTVTPDSNGWIRFQGEDGYKGSYWLRDQAAPSAPRWRMDPVGMPERIIALETSSGVGVTDGNKGDITVTSSGTVWNINADSVGSSEIAADAVTASEIAAGAVGTTELADGGVTLPKLPDIATASVLGRATAGTGDVEVLSGAQIRTIANVADGATANTTESIQDLVDAQLVMGAKLTKTYDDAGAGTITIAHLEPTPRTITGSSTLAIGDANAAIYDTGGSANVLTIPTNASVAFPTDTQIEVWALGAGALSITASSGVTLNGVTAGSSTPSQFSRTVLRKTGTNAWAATGGGGTVGTLATIVAGTILRCPWNGTAWTYAGTALTDRPSTRTDIFFQLTGAPYATADPAWMLVGDDRVDL